MDLKKTSGLASEVIQSRQKLADMLTAASELSEQAAAAHQAYEKAKAEHNDQVTRLTSLLSVE
jgi:hypothetical protein